MKKYRNISGESGISHYEIGEDFIRIRFMHGDVYTYDHVRPGKAKVQRMKTYAEKGEGLSTYISQHVRDNYRSKDE